MQSQNKKMTRFKNAIRQHDIISKKHKQAALRVTCSKLYDFSCLRRFQFSEIEYDLFLGTPCVYRGFRG